jgi:uncharacterized delta-60 repeat protein
MEEHNRFIFLILLFSAMATYAQSGVLDPAFGNDGIVTTFIAGDFNSGEAAVVQPDGKIIVACQAGDAFTFKVAVARYNTDGTLDNSFGNSGTLIIPVGSARSYARNIALQDDGKIVIAAYTYDDISSDFALVRLEPFGALDDSFGNNGISIADGGGQEVLDAMTILDDGKILLAGNNHYDFLMAKFNSDGSLDTGFGVNGWVTTHFDASDSQVKDVIYQDDGKILLGGYFIDNSSGRYGIAAARLHEDGTLDETFGTSGKVSLNIGNYDDYAVAIEVQSDGKIILGGYTGADSNFGKHDFAAIRLNIDGSLDDSYGNGGIVITRVIDEGQNYVEEMLIQPDDKIILVGFAALNSDSNLAMLRLDTMGNVDLTFGNEGKVLTDIDGREDFGKAITLQPDNKIILTGFSNNNEAVAEMVVARYTNLVLETPEHQKLKFELYPNPASQFITVELNVEDTTYQVEVLDLLGKKLFSSEIQKMGKMDISTLASGAYLMRLNSKTNTNVVRFIKR